MVHLVNVTVTLLRTADVWSVRTDGPAAERLQIVDLFGTNVLPTPFPTSMPMQLVAAELRERNPEWTILYHPTREEADAAADSLLARRLRTAREVITAAACCCERITTHPCPVHDR